VSGWLEALLLGLVGQSSLLVAGVAVCWITVPRTIVGLLAGFGAGALLASVSFDLLAETDGLEQWEVVGLMLLGAAVFLGGDAFVERKFGDDGEAGALGIVVGSVVDGVPESVIFGIQVAAGVPISVSFMIAVLVSNFPQAIAPSADLAAGGWSAMRLGRLWAAVVAACGVAALLGYLAADVSSAVTGRGMAALAAGGILAMLTDSLVPFAYQRGGQLAGAATVLGFCLSAL
jgi:ZIP family zinc transporter